ncbi:hypothetical protein [Prevotella sp. HUN102]|uniref:hypothetical protein n=1 Tax=Prevotella sp. HUN102 TaxID=1392486 RepID=UPI0012DE0FF7|nr:hypothetical protein [Prevotella sp. HUN102]
MKIVNLFAIIAIALCCCACSSDDDGVSEKEKPQPEVEVSKDEYYIRYEVTCTSDNPKSVKEINVTTGRGNKITEMPEGTTSRWQAIFGPVKKGYNAILSCHSEDPNDNSRFHARIEVSKNNGPFVFKREDQNKDISLMYVINY